MLHKFSQRGHYIVLDVNSGAVHEVDQLMYSLLDYINPPLISIPKEAFEALPQYSRDEIMETFREAVALWNSGQLFSPDDYGSYAANMAESPIKAMCLNVSHDCNLRCEYCFAGKGDYEQGRMVMSLETGKAAIDFLIERSLGRRNLEVDFFGGEPLLNFEVIQGIVKYARSKEKEYGKVFRFTITTNGLFLDDNKIDYINRVMSNVVLSLDGRREVNDRVRSRVDGSGSYDAIAPKLQRLAESRGDKEYYVRGTFTKYNKDFVKDVISLSDLGFEHISLEPVVSSSSEPYALTGEDIPDIFNEYEKLAEIITDAKRKGHSLNFFHFMLDLDQGPCAIKRLRGCGCGNEYVAITPDGDIYPCHQFIGFEDWRMGSLHDGSFDLNIKKRFSKLTVYEKEDCRECWARFYCSGGCCANSMRYEGDLLKPVRLTCELEKKRLECAITIQAELLAE